VLRISVNFDDKRKLTIITTIITKFLQ